METELTRDLPMPQQEKLIWITNEIVSWMYWLKVLEREINEKLFWLSENEWKLAEEKITSLEANLYEIRNIMNILWNRLTKIKERL